MGALVVRVGIVRSAQWSNVAAIRHRSRLAGEPQSGCACLRSRDVSFPKNKLRKSLERLSRADRDKTSRRGLMRSKIDAKIERQGKAKKRKPVPGGKALQRLFHFLGQRDPKLNDDVVMALAVPKAARPKLGLTKKAMRAKVGGAAKRARPKGRRGASPAAKKYATAIIKAATALAKKAPRGRTAARATKARGRRGAAALSALSTWQPIGPSNIPNGQTYGTNRVDVIGRVSCIAVDPSNAGHLLLGSAGGGIWEMTTPKIPVNGAPWIPRSDFLPSLAIGAIAFDPTNPARVYAGSGEGNFYANLGAGVYKSTNGGTTWTASASAPFIGVGFFDLVVDRENPAVLYAATTNGFYKSTNSGASWSLKRAGRCWDISLHPNGGMVELLASFVDGLFVSTNAGNSFTAVALPSGPTSGWTRLAVDRVTAAPDVAYLFGAAGAGAHLWRRTGTTWTKITSFPALNISQAWYDWYVAAPPDGSGRVYIGAIDTIRGDLPGSTWKWTNVTTHGTNSVHPDQHCLTFSPGNSKIIYAGNDGGIFRSTDSGETRTMELSATPVRPYGSTLPTETAAIAASIN